MSREIGVAGLTLRCMAGGGCVMNIEWSAGADADADRILRAGQVPAFACLAAGQDGCQAEIADVIAGGRCFSLDEGRAWLADVLRRFPGCAVAVAGTGNGGCLAADRCGGAVIAEVQGASREPGLGALACGLFVYGWLCAGRALVTLEPPVLRVRARSPQRWWPRLAQGSVLSCSPGTVGASPAMAVLASRSRTPLASGAPRPV